MENQRLSTASGKRFAQLCITCGGFSMVALLASFAMIVTSSGQLMVPAIVLSFGAPFLAASGLIAGIIAIIYPSARSGRYLFFVVAGILFSGVVLYLFVPGEW